MADPAARVPMTVDEYLAFERASTEKHEFADGEIFAMSGGTYEHSIISQAFGATLRTALAGRKCSVPNSDMKIQVPSSEKFVYPDAAVVCGRPQFKDDKRDVLLNPRVIVEVLSPTTEAYDRGDKFANYRTIPSLMHYILAAQDKPFVEVYTRQEDGAWMLREYGPGTQIKLSAVDCSLDVDQIYAGVFDEYDVG